MNNLLNKPPTRSQWQICAQDVNCPGESKKRQERTRGRQSLVGRMVPESLPGIRF